MIRLFACVGWLSRATQLHTGAARFSLAMPLSAFLFSLPCHCLLTNFRAPSLTFIRSLNTLLAPLLLSHQCTAAQTGSGSGEAVAGVRTSQGTGPRWRHECIQVRGASLGGVGGGGRGCLFGCVCRCFCVVCGCLCLFGVSYDILCGRMSLFGCSDACKCTSRCVHVHTLNIHAYAEQIFVHGWVQRDEQCRCLVCV